MSALVLGPGFEWKINVGKLVLAFLFAQGQSGKAFFLKNEEARKWIWCEVHA